MLTQFWKRFFSPSSYDRTQLVNWIAQLDWNEIQHFKINCNGEQVRSHYEAYQNWHYEWQTLEGEEKHITLFQPQKQSGEPISRLEVRGFYKQRLEFSFKGSLDSTKKCDLPFRQMLADSENRTFLTSPAGEVLGNMQSLNGEFVEFLLKELINLVRPVEKKKNKGELREDEARGLEWIRVSYQLLEQAIEKARNRPEEFQEEWTLSFARTGPNAEGEIEIRLLAFNLDTLITASPGDSLNVSIYDHKNFKRPIQQSSFMGEFEAGAADFTSLFSTLLKKLVK